MDLRPAAGANAGKYRTVAHVSLVRCGAVLYCSVRRVLLVCGLLSLLYTEYSYG
jgi:hypothetical protein